MGQGTVGGIKWQDLMSTAEERKNTSKASKLQPSAGWRIVINIIELNNHGLMAELLKYHHRGERKISL